MSKHAYLIAIPLIVGFMPAQADTWKQVTDEQVLARIFTDTTMEATLAGGSKAMAQYNADGSGELRAWGGKFPRQWKIENDQACLHISQNWTCFVVDKNVTTENDYRATQVENGKQVEFSVKDNAVTQVSTNTPSTSTRAQQDSGGAAKPSIDEIAKELANPNAPLATLNVKFQYKTYSGDLPEADKQSSGLFLFQPSFPFSLDNGDLVFFRPAFPVLIDQPTINADTGDFEGKTALGDIGFDLAYGITTKTGWAFATGVVASLPTATDDDLGSQRYSLGPELLVAKLGASYVLGAYPNHQWDVAGSGDKEVNLTNMQVFGIWLPGGGWNVGSTPIFTYDHVSDQATIPLNITIGKTVILGGRPWKLGIELNHYVEKSDAFGPEWMIGFNFGPVVENVLSDLF
jgi:hypothetical protein